jgi:hypothetical protein
LLQRLHFHGELRRIRVCQWRHIGRKLLPENVLRAHDWLWWWWDVYCRHPQSATVTGTESDTNTK